MIYIYIYCNNRGDRQTGTRLQRVFDGLTTLTPFDLTRLYFYLQMLPKISSFFHEMFWF